MGAQTWEEMLTTPGNGYWAAAPVDGPTLANSAALTDVAPVPQLSLPAGFMDQGRVLKVTASGKFSNTGTPTLKLGVYWGGVAGVDLASTGAITTITAATNWPWRLEAYIQCRSAGTTGTFRTLGMVLMPASLTQFQAAYGLPSTAIADVTVDTTIAKLLTVGAQWGTANAANTLILSHFFVEARN